MGLTRFWAGCGRGIDHPLLVGQGYDSGIICVEDRSRIVMMLLLERREGRPAIMKNLFLGVALVVFCPGVALAEVESGLQEPNQAIIVTGEGLPLPPEIGRAQVCTTATNEHLV